jgi:succinoglycan biosynthesis protein ExoA
LRLASARLNLAADASAGRPAAAADAAPLTVIIPTHGRLTDLKRCLASIVTPELPADAELVVVCNGPDAESEGFLDQLAAREPRLIVMRLAKRQPGAARNAAVDRARGEIIFFLDDDVTVRPGFFSGVMRLFAERPELDVLGGPNLTPLESGRFEHCVGRVLASPFGSATTRHRFRSAGRLRPADDRSLILCNLIVRRRALEGPNAPFRDHMISNEENVLLAELAFEHKVMLHDPELIVYHSRRPNLRGFFNQVFRYGRGRWQNTEALPSSLSPFFLIPVLFLLYLLSIPIVRSPLYLVPLLAYVALAVLFSLVETLRAGDLRAFLTLLVLFPCCHLGYAMGFGWQLVRSLASRWFGAGTMYSPE